jgi:hypothetical protein
MTAFAFWRMLAKPLAPLCASPLEGAQATDLGPDKRDSLRPCPAVDFSRFAEPFAQAVPFARSPPRYVTACSESKIFTSSLCAHVR